MDSDFDPVDGFSTDNFVGVFMWGDVFRGKAYLNGMQPQEVTVKIWDDSNGVIMDGYRDNSISRFRDELLFFTDHHVKFHPNLAKLLGYCFEGNRFGVVYDMKPVITLYNLIPQDNFGWLFRMMVAFEIARLLEFMHSSTDHLPPYLIRNINSNHIMLDQDCNSYLFELSLISGGILTDKGMDRMDFFTGDICYRDPYFFFRGSRWTELNDVYAYGCLLLELIRKSVLDAENDTFDYEIPHLYGRAICEYEKSKDDMGSDFSLVHRSLVEEQVFHPGDGPKITKLILKCMDFYPSDRPTMEEVIDSLLDLEVIKCHSELFLGFKRMARIPYPRERRYSERQKNSSSTMKKSK